MALHIGKELQSKLGTLGAGEIALLRNELLIMLSNSKRSVLK